MKPYIAIIIPAVLILVVFAVGYISAPALESSRDSLYREIDEQVELAQRLLNQYNPAAPNLLSALTPSTTQPARIDDEKWREYVQQAEEAEAATAFSALNTSLERQRGELRTLEQEFQQLGGEGPAGKPVPSGSEALDTLKDQLRANETILAKAREILEAAIARSAGEGDSAVSGDRHPEATRLLAIVIHAQADMLRREAALRRAAADHDRDRFARLVASARRLDREVDSLQQELTGGAPATSAARPGPTTEAKPGPAKPAGEEPVPKPGEQKRRGILGNVLDRVKGAAAGLGGPGAEPPAPDKPAEEPQAAPEAAPEPVERPDFRPPEAVPALSARIATLQKQRTQVTAEIAAAEAEVARLTDEIESTTNRMETAQSEAAETQKQMLALEQQGVDPAEPGSLPQFIERYNALAAAHRRAAREAATLEYGAVRNARSGTEDLEKLLETPLVPADPGKPMAPERGLTALKSELEGAQELVRTNKAVLVEIDRQSADLAARLQSVEQRLARLRTQRQELVAQIAARAAMALAAVAEAGALEDRAVALAEGAGLRAAQQAQTAADDASERTREFISTENPAETPDRKLSDMAGDTFPVGHVAALEGDFQYLVAGTHAQQATGLDAHQRMLEAMAAAGVPVTVDAKLLGEDVAADSVPEYVTNTAAAAKVASEARAKAVQAGLLAVEAYEKAARDLKDMWIVHVNIAAVHSLLARLPRAADDAVDHLAKARSIYERAIRGHETLPEYPVYRRIADHLAASQQPGP